MNNENREYRFRGGSWDTYPRVCSSTCRHYYFSRDVFLNNIGFRIVRRRK